MPKAGVQDRKAGSKKPEVFCCLLLVLASCLAVSGGAQDRIPVQASLVRTVEAGRINIGDTILAAVDVKWETPDCQLRKGAILRGRVVAQTPRSKATRNSSIAILFENAECDGAALKPLRLTLAAVMVGETHRDSSQYQSPPLADAIGLSLKGNARSLSTAAATVYTQPDVQKRPSTIKPGEIQGIKGLQLKVGTGPEGSSVLFAPGRNVRLNAGSQLVLIPHVAAASLTNLDRDRTVLSPAPANFNSGLSEPEPIDESEICSPPNCNLALASADVNSAPATASLVLPIANTGYGQIDRERIGFAYDSSIAYLGAKQLLFTFNPHQLVRRTGSEAKFSKLRTIRAMLIDVSTGRVEKTLDWKVPDEQQYIWSVGRDNVLVHVGHELRLYGPNLRLQQRIPLDGPLAFVSASPSSLYFAIGITRERHDDVVHRELMDAESREPEEDIEIKVLDSDFHAVGSTIQSSRAMRPVLSDQGEIRISSVRRNRWRISENRWDSQKHIIAQVNSSCLPHVTTLPADLLFVVGCDRLTSGKWYRVLRPDGKPVLKGWSPSSELEQRASGTMAADSFSVAVAQATKSMDVNSPFHFKELDSERISVYRSPNGEKAFSITISSPVPTVQSFVLSPDGNQLAVLSRDQIALYPLRALPQH